MGDEPAQECITMTIEEIAKVCHEANRVYCASLGDYSQRYWIDAPEWQRKSAINGVQFHIQSPDAGPSGSHESWMKEKVADGWKCGPVKDAEKKEHPCIVPYDQLPQTQQLKDSLFIAIVHSLSGAHEPWCCMPGCGKAAKFDLYDRRDPNYTQACADHVEELKSDNHHETVPIGHEGPC